MKFELFYFNSKMPKWFNWLYFMAYLLAYSNSAINPIFIANLNKFYKAGTFKINPDYH